MNMLDKIAQNMMREYNIKLHKNEYKLRDPVWLFIPKSCNKGKFNCSWAGPYRIYKKINDGLYQIKKGPKTRPKKQFITIILNHTWELICHIGKNCIFLFI